MGVGPGHVDRKRRESVEDPAGSTHHPLGSFDQRERKPDATAAHTGPDPGHAHLIAARGGEENQKDEGEMTHEARASGERKQGSVGVFHEPLDRCSWMPFTKPSSEAAHLRDRYPSPVRWTRSARPTGARSSRRNLPS